MGKNADFSQFEKFCKNWQDTCKDFDDFLRKFLLEMAQRAINDIKKNTPVDTGALRNTWAAGNAAVQVGRTNDQKVSAFEQEATIESVKVVGDSLEITIFNAMEYASFVEFGHRNWLNNSWVDGYFMMTIGIDKIQQQIPARFQKAFQNYLMDKGAT